MHTSCNFQDFAQSYEDWEKKFGVYQRDDAVYKRIVCHYDEEIDSPEKKILHHEYHACINTQTGELYIDCRKRKILAKHITLALIRPLHTVIKMLWHLTFVGPLAIEIFLWKAKKQTLKDVGINSLKSFADIGRTPFYGSAITITHIAGAIFGIISPNTLYKSRDLVGRLERRLLRVDDIKKAFLFALVPCFSPLSNIHKTSSNELITDEAKVKERLVWFAFSQIHYRRTQQAFFNDLWALFPKNQTYISAAHRLSKSSF